MGRRIYSRKAGSGFGMKQAQIMRPFARIGKMIKAARIDAGMDQIALGKKAKVTQCVISKIENGKVNFTFHTIVSLTKALKIPLSDLVR